MRDFIGRVKRSLDLRRGRLPLQTVRQFKVDSYEAPEGSPLGAIVAGHRGRLVDKWDHYIPVYERYFGPWRNRPLFFLEIGVFKGGSLEIWREYFGQQAVIVGVDIDPECANVVDAPNHVRIGSQDDPAFLHKVIEEFGQPDLILDDGSHFAHHQKAAFEILWPLLKDGGVYMLEDCHTAYWPGVWRGGLRRPGTAIEFGKDRVDDLHHWYSRKPPRVEQGDRIRSVAFYDSMVVYEKGPADRPRHFQLSGNNPAP
jgi:Methyltransferase domain